MQHRHISAFLLMCKYYAYRQYFFHGKKDKLFVILSAAPPVESAYFYNDRNHAACVLRLLVKLFCNKDSEQCKTDRKKMKN